MPMAAEMQKKKANVAKPLRLDETTGTEVRRGFGIDPGQLELRESPEVRAMGARAVAQGNVIQFAPGEFSPGTAEGRAVLGHELAHVRSQALGEVPMTGGLLEEPGYEAAADRAGAAFAAGGLAASGPVDAGALAGQNAPAQGLFGWARKIGKNFRIAQNEGREQRAALGYQGQMNENLRQGDFLDDQLANAQYRRDNLPGIRRGMGSLRHDTAVSKWDSTYEQGRGGIGRWLGKRLFQSRAGADALTSMRGQVSDQTDWGDQAAGLQEQVNQRNQNYLQAATHRRAVGNQKNAVQAATAARTGINVPSLVISSRLASLIQPGGAPQDEQYNEQLLGAMAPLTEGGVVLNPEQLEKVRAVTEPPIRRVINADVERYRTMSDDELIAHFPEICELERPTMFLADIMKKFVSVMREDENGVPQKMPFGKVLLTEQEMQMYSKNMEILNTLMQYCEGTAVLQQPEITDAMVSPNLTGMSQENKRHNIGNRNENMKARVGRFRQNQPMRG